MSSLRLERLPDGRTGPQGAVERAENTLDPLAAIRRRQQQLALAQTRDFDLPGYDGELVVRYRRLGVQAFRDAIFGNADTEIDANAQFLIDACDGLYRRRDDGTLHPLWPDDQEHRPTVAPRFWDLAEMLDLPGDTLRGQVLALFGGNELAVTEHSGRVEEWMRSVQAEEDDRALGG